MNRILFMLLAVLLILSIFAAGCGGPCVMRLAPIGDVDVWADESLPPQYFLDVVSMEMDGCEHFDSYNMTRAGNTTIILEFFNLDCPGFCPAMVSFVEHTIPLGSDFVPGGNYTVEINNVTVNFIAGVIMIYLAPIHYNIEIWHDASSPPQYFVNVLSGEPSICDHFNSYNVTRTGNTTILVEVFNRRCCTGCPDDYNNVELTIPLGSDFIPGGSYTVVVNNVTETFVA